MYLPILINVERHPFTIFGGGKIALRKTLKIIEYGGSVRCISPEFKSEFGELEGVGCLKDHYKRSLLPDHGLVIAATNDRKVNKQILMDCEEKGILCVRVDSGEDSDFIFSADFQTEDLIISVSTKGKNPGKSKRILEELIHRYDEKKEIDHEN